MGNCMVCNKESGILFDVEGKHICWLCSSRRQVKNMSNDTEYQQQEKEFEERRAWQRYPVQIHMKMSYGANEQSKIIFPGTAINLSLGGMCIEWAPCEACGGYVPGAMSPDCIFSRYSVDDANAEILYISLFLSEKEVINLSCKVVFVIKKEQNTEYIGLCFVNIDKNTQQMINDIIAKILEYGKT